MNRPILLLGLAASLAPLGGCINEPLPAGEVCTDVGYSIANRTYECTNDAKLANARYERLTSGFKCKAADYKIRNALTEQTPPAEDGKHLYECPAGIAMLTCDQVKALGEDYVGWLIMASPSCADVFSMKDGSPLFGGGAGGAGMVMGSGHLTMSGTFGTSPFNGDCDVTDPKMLFQSPGNLMTAKGQLGCGSVFINYDSPIVGQSYQPADGSNNTVNIQVFGEGIFNSSSNMNIQSYSLIYDQASYDAGLFTISGQLMVTAVVGQDRVNPSTFMVSFSASARCTDGCR